MPPHDLNLIFIGMNQKKLKKVEKMLLKSRAILPAYIWLNVLFIDMLLTLSMLLQ